MIRLLTPWPAMLVEGDERMLLAADFHLGIEYELAKMGINIPYQTDRFLDELLGLVKEHEPDRVVLLGDIKHGVPITSFQEKREIPKFFGALQELVSHIDVARGNHDGNIQNLTPEGVRIQPSRGFKIGEELRISVLHGHAWPYPKLLDCDLMVLGHNHPTVLLNTPLGVHISQRAWVRGRLDSAKLAEIYLQQARIDHGGDPLRVFEEHFDIGIDNPELVIMPTFNDLMGGLPVNSETPKSLLGPLFRAEAVDIEEFDTYLLDGTFLGNVKFLRTLI